MTTERSYPLDRACPECEQNEVEYNGNYFCRACRWALSESSPVQPWLRSLIRLRRGQGQDTTREEFYLTPDSKKVLERSAR